jgi:predicted regulator of Ras-like GTPase activity (Roadblock/LC7/MglB family)
MSERARQAEWDRDGAGPDVASPPSRARSFNEILAELTKLGGVRGGLIVAPDGLVIASTLHARFAVEALAALGATLGRELERGTERLGRGELRTAVFAAPDGMIVMGTSPVGFLILLGDRDTEVAAVRTALREVLPRLDGHSS